MGGPRRRSRGAQAGVSAGPPADAPGAARDALLVLASGFAALASETALARAFLDVLGSSLAANAAVVAGTLGGLCAGALVATRLAGGPRPPGRVAASLVAVGGGCALAVPEVLRISARLADAALGRMGASPESPAAEAARAALALLLAALPAAFFGTTLPLACEHAARRGTGSGRPFASLYAWSTAGGAAGALLAGLVLLRDLGVTGTLAVAFACAAASAVPLLVAPAPVGVSVAPPPPATSVGAGAGVPLGLASLVLSAGIVSIGLEVAWTRSLVLFLGSSLRTFSLVLATVLVAMALGAALVARARPGPGSPLAPFGLAAGLLSVSAAGTLLLVARPEGLVALASAWGGGDPHAALGARLVVAGAFLVAPGLAMGALLPLAVLALPPGTGNVGRLYAASAAGNVAGALLSGFLLVPAVGPTRSVALLAWAALPVAGVALVRAPAVHASRRLGLVALAAAAVLAPQLAAVRPRETRLARLGRVGTVVDAKEGARGLVSVTEVPPLPLLVDDLGPPDLLTPGARYRVIAVDGVEVAGTAPDLRLTQRMQAHVPLLLHGRARQVLQVGYGSGETTRTAALHGPETLDVVEINPDVVSVARRWFPFPPPPGSRLCIGDAKGFLRRARRSWDVILNDSTYPGVAGSSQLYSADHFAACRKRLAPGGIVSTWLPVDLPPETFRTVLASFARTFPDAAFYLPTGCLNKHGVLVGRTADPGAAAPVPGAVATSLAEVGYPDPADVISDRVLDARAIARLVAGIPPSTDDRPRLDYPPRHGRVSGDDFWVETLGLLVEALHTSGGEPERDCGREATRLLLLGQRELLRAEPDRALRLFLEAEAACPSSAPRARALVRGILVHRAQREFALALEAISRGGSAEAIVRLRESVRLFPHAAAARFELGRLLLGAGRAAEAARELEACLSIGTTSRAASVLLGDAYVATGRIEEADAAYRRSQEAGSAEAAARLRALRESGPAFAPSAPGVPPESSRERRPAEAAGSRTPPPS